MNLKIITFKGVHNPLNSAEPGKLYVLCPEISTSCFLWTLNERFALKMSHFLNVYLKLLVLANIGSGTLGQVVPRSDPVVLLLLLCNCQEKGQTASCRD